MLASYFGLVPLGSDFKYFNALSSHTKSQVELLPDVTGRPALFNEGAHDLLASPLLKFC
jgi:hypothetical protein